MRTRLHVGCDFDNGMEPTFSLESSIVDVFGKLFNWTLKDGRSFMFFNCSAA